jgi:thiol-disulfide isomerase/thioredoxin|tara:strand:+ start:858 stop:1325 length:468 start_codon:yes stop_codon:yes gene_type:complete
MKFVSIAPDGAVLFDSMVSDKPAFVKFYHPECGHCRSMAPEWDALKDELNGSTLDANVIEVHADAISDIKSNCARNIEGFPTLMMVGKGGETTTAYNGERTRKHLADFMKKNVPKSGGRKSRRRMRKMKKRKTRTRRKHVRKTGKRKNKRRKTRK